MTGEAEIITSIAGFLNAGAVIILYWLMSRSNSATETNSEKFKSAALESLGGIVLALISRVNIANYFKEEEANKTETLPHPAITKDKQLDLMDFIKGMIEASMESIEKTKPLTRSYEMPEGSQEPDPNDTSPSTLEYLEYLKEKREKEGRPVSADEPIAMSLMDITSNEHADEAIALVENALECKKSIMDIEPSGQAKEPLP